MPALANQSGYNDAPPDGLTLVGVRHAEAATDWLTSELQTLRPAAFDVPLVLAHHPALRRSLTLGIARSTGCAASIRFVSPTGWVDEIAGLEGIDGEWRPTAMAWRLTASMAEHVADLPISVRTVIEADDTVVVLNIARAIAARFRAYLLHRPELLLAWESTDSAPISEQSERWQRTLWRALLARTESRSPAQIVAELNAGRFVCAEDVPRVILAVADPTMPPTVRTVLRAVSTQRDVRWCVIASGGTAERAIVSPRLRAATRVLLDLGLAPMAVGDDAPSTLLGGVQRILAGDDSGSTPRRPLDDTLTLHACHSPLREIETLRERLVVAMEADSELRPHDVTLYVTSLERYLPAIDAVFDVDEEGMPRLPYNVAGRPFRDRSPMVFAVLRLLEASEGRETLEEISSLLRLTPIADAAGFTEDETTEALALAVRAGIVWGTDGADRHERFQLPPIDAGTWRRGIDRLVLGLAMGPTDSPVGDVLPVSGETAGRGDLIGRVSEWTERLFSLFADLRTSRRAAAWAEVLEGVVQTFVRARGPADYEAQRTLRSVVARVLGSIEKASPDVLVGITAVRTLLEQSFEDIAGELGDLRGGLRVCRLEPGAILPAKVVLIAGVDDALHPGGGGTPAWDLLSKGQRDEDPDRRADALDAFRQAIASARSRAHVAWTGFTMAQHDQRAPSVAVSELGDIAKRILVGDAEKRLVRAEPAHPFSASLFSTNPSPERIQSAALGWQRAARLISTRGDQHREFVDAPLDRSTGASRVIALDTIASCIKDPTLYFCRRVLGLQMSDDDEEFSEREPQAVNPPGEKGVHNDLRPISWRLESAARRGDVRGVDELTEWLRHQPEIPYGEEGRVLAAAVAREWLPQIERLRSIDWQPPLAVNLEVGEWTIIGRLDRLTPAARVMESLYKIQPHSAIGHWVPHLVMNVLADRGAALPRETHFVDETHWKLDPVGNAEEELRRLCAFYDEACVAPQPLFRRAGCAWLKATGVRRADETNPEELEKAFRAAREKWFTPTVLPGQPSFPGEGESPSGLLCWATSGFDDPAFTSRFVRCTEQILLPFMQACVDGADT